MRTDAARTRLEAERERERERERESIFVYDDPRGNRMWGNAESAVERLRRREGSEPEG